MYTASLVAVVSNTLVIETKRALETRLKKGNQTGRDREVGLGGAYLN